MSVCHSQCSQLPVREREVPSAVPVHWARQWWAIRFKRSECGQQSLMEKSSLSSQIPDEREPLNDIVISSTHEKRTQPDINYALKWKEKNGLE